MMVSVPPAPRAGLSLPAAIFLAGLCACTQGPLDVIDLDPGSANDDLVAHWSFDEGTGNVLFDSSGNLHHGQIQVASQIKRGTTFTVTLPLNLSDN